MNNFLTKSEFSRIVEKHVLDRKMSYMEAALCACEDHGIDPEDIKKFVSTPIRDKIEGEAMKLNLIPRSNELFF